ncbi:FecR domain-containing protein [Desulfococcaceae bacterium HSG9]|nr:FecR domain-containing protein [Desulfococcaceae bacterium HSG9]
MYKKFIIIILTLMIGHVSAPGAGFTRTQEKVEVVFKQDVSLRSLAQEYLGDPNAWEIILYYNGFKHPSELRPAMKLTIPTGTFKRTVKYLKKAGEISHLANMEGAGILAKDSIEASNRLHISATDLKKRGKLELAEKTALESVQQAEKALAEAKAKKIRTVSAILEKKKKTVQSRRPDQPVWINTMTDQELIEQERIRTLADSEAGIVFIDGSRIYMDENSLAVIGEMRKNLIKNTFKADVTVLQGEVLAHISSIGGRKDFNITAPGVETAVRSRKFRTGRDTGKATRIANYDGEIDVKAGNSAVTVKKDEGTKIAYGKKPETPRKLLPPPVFIPPLNDRIFFSQTIRFEWEKVENAKFYKLVISADRDFTDILKNIRTAKTHFQWRVPRKGVYYCRIYSIDRDNFSGPFAAPVSFFANVDVSPPYLTVRSPMDGDVILSESVMVRGTFEKSAKITIDDQPVDSDENGGVNHSVELEPGEQIITIIAADPAGNRSIVRRKVIRNTEKQLIYLDTPNRMTVNLNQVAITGKIRPHTKIEINGEPVEAKRDFSHVLKLPEGDHTITVKATSPLGKVQTLPVMIRVDQTPPKILPDDFPKFTRKPKIRLSGRISEHVTFSVNGSPAPLKKKTFDLTVQLKEGENIYKLEAKDDAGNMSAKKINIFRDTKPPEIGDYSFSHPAVKGGNIITCRVFAKDDGVGLARTGSFTISVDPEDKGVKGALTLNSVKKKYEGSVFIPPGMKGKVKMKALKIQDYLGNQTVWP